MGTPRRLAGWGWSWGVGFGQGGKRGLGRTLLPASASNLADPRPDPCSSLICLSSKDVKLIRSPAKSSGSNPSLPSGSAGFGSAGLAGAWQAAARRCRCPARSPSPLQRSGDPLPQAPSPSSSSPHVPPGTGCH